MDISNGCFKGFQIAQFSPFEFLQTEKTSRAIWVAGCRRGRHRRDDDLHRARGAVAAPGGGAIDFR